MKLYRFPERERKKEREREREYRDLVYISTVPDRRLLSICLIFHRDFRHVDLYDNWLADQNINVASEWQCPRSEYRFAEKNNLSPIVSAGCILNSAEANDEDLIERSKELHGVYDETFTTRVPLNVIHYQRSVSSSSSLIAR